MKERILIVGLDGADWKILEPLMAEGRMPNLKQLVDEGASGFLRSTVPPVTVPAWSSFMTGKNPSKHGIYEFLVKEPGSYAEHPISARDRKARTIWRILSDADKRVVCLNVPTTYPPEETNGVMISGFLTPSFSRDFVRPKELLPEIEEKFGPYYLYMKTKIIGIGRNDKAVASILEDCRAMLDYKTRIACYLAEKEDPDVLMTHVWGTDRIQHELWDVLDPTHPRSKPKKVERHLEAVKDYYTYLDGKIGEMRSAMGRDVCVMIVSDHGFGSIQKVIDLNWWLYEQGYLKFKDDIGTRLRLGLWKLGLNWANLFNLSIRLMSLFKPLKQRASPASELTRFHLGKKGLLLSMADVDWGRTKAYGKTGMGQIFLNVAGREPQGCVKPGEEYEDLRRELADGLADLLDPETEKPIGGDVYLREDIYAGGMIEDCPDVTYIAQDQGYMATSLTGLMGNKTFVRIGSFYGNHTMNGVVVLHGDRIKKGVRIEKASLLDIAPTVLHLMGLPIPDQMDGHVLLETLTEEFVRHNPLRTVPDPGDPEGNGSRMSAEEEAEVLEKLQQLGYIG